MTTFDLIVIGAGAYGSAAAYHAAKRGLRVLLLEQFEIDHGRGSSYGHSRIIRYAYDHPVYVELAKAAYGEWDALQQEMGETLWVKTGGLDFGVPGSEPMLDGMIRSLAETGIPHELLSPEDVQRRFPQFRLDEDMIGLYQADAGVLFASRCVLAHVRLARAYGADIREHTAVSAFERHADSVTVHTSAGSFSAVATWMPHLSRWSWPKLKAGLNANPPLA
ncbi:FAD-dependent oxidoreductase [Anaerolineae bacterium CFX9]|nr:FAD-dependent oxidoreductase [Anaerolineae bacterium CFX9]